MYAIIADSGKQFKVTSGDTILIDRPLTDSGTTEKTITFDRVLLVAGEGTPKIGSPIISGATVTAEVLGAEKGIKTDAVKYKRRKGFHKKVGHRQNYLRVKVTGINV